jgi:glucose/mannose transport system substrate-binding protein
MSMRRVKFRYGLAAMICAFGVAPPAMAQRADVIHWWTSGGESRAVRALADAYNKAGGTWVDNAVVGGPASRAASMDRIAGGNPPTAMQWNTPVALHELDDQGVLANLDDVARAQDWKAALPPVVYNAITWHDHVIALPLDLQNLSGMYYSTKIFHDLGLQVPKTWDDFFVVADKIKAAGLIPIAIAGQPSFISSTMQAVLLGTAGPGDYRKIFVQHDAKAAAGPGVTAAFGVLRRLSQYADPGSPNRKWNDTALLVGNNKAAMYIMGDWAKGDFLAAGEKVGQEFGCAPAPGTTGYEIVSVDTFAFPKHSGSSGDAARTKLAETLMQPAVQIAFNQAKGALPARSDAKLPVMDACSQMSADIVEQQPTHLMPNSGLAFTADVDGQLSDLFNQFWSNSAMTSQQATAQFARIIGNADS